MTAPRASKQADPAPNGYLASGVISGSVEDTRDNLINDFLTKTTDLRNNTLYYTSQRRPDAIGIAVPPEMQKLLAYVGYPRLYVDSIAERLELEGFTLGGTTAKGTGSGKQAPSQASSAPKPAPAAAPAAPPAPSAPSGASKPASAQQDDVSTPQASQLWDWWQANNLDVEAPLGHTEALVHGRSYITIAAPDPAVDLFVDPTVPIIRVEPPNSLYAYIDPRTRQVTQAFRYITGAAGTSKEGQVIATTLYLPNQTVAWAKDDTGAWQVVQQVPHNLGVVPVVPLSNRTLLSDLTGTSEITPELRSITDAAARILMDMQGAAELMGIPQRLLFGVKPQEIGVDPETGQSRYDAYMARILAFEEESGKAFQFDAAELRNFCDALDQLDRKAAAYTGLPPQYLSYSSQNPASAEAIQSSEARLVKKCERKNLVFGGAWEQAMRIAYAVMNGGMQGLPPEYYRLESIWRDPATPTYAAKADAATKAYASGSGIIPKERARIDLGYTIAEREEMRIWDQAEQQQMLQALASTTSITGGPQQGPGNNPAQPSSSQTSSSTPPSSTKTATATPPT